MEAELGRLIRGRTEEIWTAIADEDGIVTIKYVSRAVVGANAQRTDYMSPAVLYASDAPDAIKEKVLKNVAGASRLKA